MPPTGTRPQFRRITECLRVRGTTAGDHSHMNDRSGEWRVGVAVLRLRQDPIGPESANAKQALWRRVMTDTGPLWFAG